MWLWEKPPKQWRKKWGSNLDASAQRKKWNKLNWANSLSLSLQAFKSIPPPPSELPASDSIQTSKPSLHIISSGTDSDYSVNENQKYELDYHSRRMAIFYYYAQVLKCPKQSKWNESATIIHKSLQLLFSARHSNLYNLFQNFDDLRTKNEEHDEKRLISAKIDKRVIDSNSTEA